MGFDPGTVRVDPEHPSNKKVDWLAVGAFLENGARTAALPARLWVDGGPKADAIGIPGSSGNLVSSRLRDVLDHSAPGCITFHPVAVDDAMFWLMCVAVIDALQPTAGDVSLDQYGMVLYIKHPVWKGNTLRRPSIFRIPQSRSHRWVTDAVAAAYRASGCTGLLIYGPTGEIR